MVTQEPTPYNILVVDDDELLLDSISDLLGFLGYKTLSAQSGMDAIEVLLNNFSEIDLVISDLNMPDITGFELLDKMYEDQDLRQIPVLMVSGQNDQRTLRNSFKNGAVEYLPKPFKNDELIKSIKNILQDGTEKNITVERNKDLQSLQNKINHVNQVNAHSLRHANSKILQVLELHKLELIDSKSALEMINEMGYEIETISNEIQQIMETNIDAAHVLMNDPSIKHISKVWFVDDDKVTNIMHRIMAEKFLEPDVEIFDDPGNALTQIQGRDIQPDLIFLDLNMPEVSGFDFLEALKDREDSIPVVVLSSSTQQADITRSLAYNNVITYLTKPLKKETLTLLNLRQ